MKKKIYEKKLILLHNNANHLKEYFVYEDVATYKHAYIRCNSINYSENWQQCYVKAMFRPNCEQLWWTVFKLAIK